MREMVELFWKSISISRRNMYITPEMEHFFNATGWINTIPDAILA
jgi:hypothetical protein